MARKVEFHDQHVTIRLTGLTRLLTYKKDVCLSYHQIKQIYVDQFVPPKWMTRMPGTVLPPSIYEGDFLYADEWYFLSFEHRVPHLILCLVGHEQYDYIVIELDNPEEVETSLRQRIASLLR